LPPNDVDPLVPRPLEDAVADRSKGKALANVAWLASPPDAAVQVRVNPRAAHEIRSIRATGAHVGLRIPKRPRPYGRWSRAASRPSPTAG
jgi:citrate lyase beta subunit